MKKILIFKIIFLLFFLFAFFSSINAQKIFITKPKITIPKIKRVCFNLSLWESISKTVRAPSTTNKVAASAMLPNDPENNPWAAGYVDGGGVIYLDRGEEIEVAGFDENWCNIWEYYCEGNKVMQGFGTCSRPCSWKILAPGKAVQCGSN